MSKPATKEEPHIHTRGITEVEYRILKKYGYLAIEYTMGKYSLDIGEQIMIFNLPYELAKGADALRTVVVSKVESPILKNTELVVIKEE